MPKWRNILPEWRSLRSARAGLPFHLAILHIILFDLHFLYIMPKWRNILSEWHSLRSARAGLPFHLAIPYIILFDLHFLYIMPKWRNGRRTRLKIVRETMRVQVPPSAPIFLSILIIDTFFYSIGLSPAFHAL